MLIKMKILHKIIAGNLIICLLFSIVALIGISSIYKINEDFGLIEYQTIPVMDTLEEMHVEALKMYASTGEYIFLHKETEKEEIEAFESSKNEINKINSSRIEFKKSFLKYKQYINEYFPEETDFLNIITDSYKNLDSKSAELTQLKDQNASALAIYRKWEGFEDAKQNFSLAIQEAMNNEYSEVSTRREKVVESIDISLKISIFFWLLSLIGTLTIGFFMSKTFSDPIKDMMEATRKIANGDLNTKIDIRSKDEIGELAKSFNIMANDLDKSRKELKENELHALESLREKDMLLREIHHRVKNNMQIISSLLNHQSEYINDSRINDVFKESQSRISSMALVHEKLYQSKDIDKIDIRDYITDLSASIFQSYQINPGRITFYMNIDNILLNIDQAIPCGLIINELMTNSIKYAFPEENTGKIRVEFHKGGDKMFELTVGDNGIGFQEKIDFRKTRSLGLHLVTILAEKQLHGQITLDQSNGTEFKIKFGELTHGTN